MDLSDFTNQISGKFKENKLLLPALIVGGVVGGYFLLKSGSNSQDSPRVGINALDPNSPSGDSASGGGGYNQSSPDVTSFTEGLTQQVSDFIASQSDTLASFQSQIDESLGTNESFYSQLTDYVNQAVEGIQSPIDSRLTGFMDTYGVSAMDTITQPIAQIDTYNPVDFSSVTPQYFTGDNAIKTGVISNPQIVAGSKSLSRSLSGVSVTPRNIINVGVSKPTSKPVKTVAPKVVSTPVPRFTVNPKYGFQTVRNRLSNSLVKPVTNSVKKTVAKK